MPRAGGVARPWRVPDMALRDGVFVAELGAAISEYFTLNEGSVSSKATLWEAFKAYTRGVCISKNAEILRDLRRTLARIEVQLADIDRQDSRPAAPSSLQQCVALVVEFWESAEREAHFLGKYAAARRYGEGE